MALRNINSDLNKIVNENILRKAPTKVQMEPSKRGPLGEIGNKPVLQRSTRVGKGINLKDVKAKVVTHHEKYPVSRDSQQKVERVHATMTTGAASKSVHLHPCQTKQKHPLSRPPTGRTTEQPVSTQPKPEPKKIETERTIDIKSEPPVVDEENVVRPLPCDVENMDTNDDPLVVSEYVMDIYRYLRELEILFPIIPNYLKGQEITERMRAVLIDWMVDVHQQFHLLQETLYLTVAIVDRFLQTYRKIDRAHLQLAGMACMWVACKYEEMYCPEVTDFVYIADNTYTKAQIVIMEGKVLQILKFNLGRPLPLHFLRRFSKAAHSDAITHTLAKYFLELTLVEYEMCHISPSLLAAASVFIAMWLVGGEKRSVWSATMEYYSEYNLDDILPVATQMSAVIVKAPEAKYQATRNKYASSKLLKISAHPKLQSSRLASIANSTNTF